MNVLSALFTCAVCHLTIAIDKEFHEEWKFDQKSLSMYYFFSELAWKDMQFVIPRDGSKDICKWHGIKCSSEKDIEAVKMSYKSSGRFHIGFLPHSAKTLTIIYCKQTFEFMARHLPMHLEWLDLSNNLITGSIECPQLPRDLLGLDLAHNHIAGPLQLMELPPKLEYMRLRFNRIQQGTIFYHNLPRSLQYISVALGDNRVGRAQPLLREDTERDVKKVFQLK